MARACSKERRDRCSEISVENVSRRKERKRKAGKKVVGYDWE